MRKFLLFVAALMLAATAFAQVNSVAGKANGDPHFNYAHRQITLKADYPDQVKFQLPQAVFNIAMNQLVPNASVDINIRVKNLSDRSIVINDTGVYPPIGGFSVSFSPVTVGPGGEAWYTYTITTGDEDALQGWLTGLAGGGLPSNVSFNPSNNVMTVVTTLEAHGLFPTNNPDSWHNF